MPPKKTEAESSWLNYWKQLLSDPVILREKGTDAFISPLFGPLYL